jgi:hypothetical protein
VTFAFGGKNNSLPFHGSIGATALSTLIPNELRSSEKRDLVRIGAEGDFVAHERVHFGASAFAPVNEADTARHQVTIGNLPKGNPGLNLMPESRSTPTYVRVSASSFPSRTRKRTPSLMMAQLRSARRRASPSRSEEFST